MSRRILGLMALVVGAAVIWALPATGFGQPNPLSPRGAADALRVATQQTGEAVQQTVQKTEAGSKQAVTKMDSAAKRQNRAPAADPQVEPPIRDTNPHGQGSGVVVDVQPSAERPYADSTDGVDSGEEVIAGRSRGEQQADGSFRGHITLLELFGNELSGVNSTPGQANHGPLEPLQAGLLDPICDASDDNLCLSLLTADSTTTNEGSVNDFAVARVRLGGANGLNVGAGEDQGTIAMEGQCQVSGGVTRSLTVVFNGEVQGSGPDALSTARQCPGQPEETNASSRFGTLGGTPIPLPQAGCGDGVPDTRFDPLDPIATIVCNAAETPSSITRNSVDVFALDLSNSSLAQASVSQAEAKAVAAAVPTGTTGSGERTGTPQCADGVDNDGDGRIDSRDGGCHTDGNPNNPDSYDATDDSEAGGNDGAAQCSDGRDNDGDGVIDADDPGCHSDGNADNADSYNPNDDSEADGGGAVDSDSLAFTGSDVIGLALAGLLVLAGGLILRRREELLS